MRGAAIQSGRKAVAALTLSALALAGCAGMSRTQRGAVTGAAVGAAAGAGIAAATGGSTTRGVLIGAAVGGAAGAIIGREMDRQARELERIQGAEVERVGEGILVTFQSGVLFSFDSEVLLPAAQENLRQFATTMRENPSTHILIAGHTDSVGTMTYNQGLSERRAASAQRFLLTQGIPAARMTTIGRGETEPRFTNDTDEGRRQNRRVEIAIYADEAWRARVQQTGP